MNRVLLISLFLISSSLVAQTWNRKSDIPSARHHPITFSINGIGYSVTGTSSANVPTKDFYDYDPVNDSWSTLPLFPGLSRSFGIGTVAPNNVAYLGFGASTVQYLRDFWSFDASDSSWTRLADCPCAGRRHPAMISIGDKIYVGLGDGATGNLDDWWMYNITTNSWTQTADFPGAGRHHPFMFNASGDVFAGLGHAGQVIYRDWYKLDTASNTWSSMRPFPGEARVAGTQFTAHGYGFVLSGDGDNHSFMQTGEMWRYDPSRDSWTQLPPHPGNSLWAPGSFVINNEVYCFGGLNRHLNFFPSNVYKFTLLDPTGIEEKENILSNTYVYPNPANNEILWNNDQSITEVRIFNSTGQLFFSSRASAGKINVDNLSDGLYLVQFLENDKPIKTSKVLIQH